MVDLRWKLMVGLLHVLHKVSCRSGRFVFAVAGRPAEVGFELVVSDTTMIPAGPAVKEEVDRIVHAHTEGVMRRMLDELPTMPNAMREALNWLLKEPKEAITDERLPARSWKSDEQADGTAS